jgi:hypothetical protein
MGSVAFDIPRWPRVCLYCKLKGRVKGFASRGRPRKRLPPSSRMRGYGGQVASRGRLRKRLPPSSRVRGYGGQACISRFPSLSCLYVPCVLCGSIRFGATRSRAAFAKASNFAKASMDKSASQGTSCLSAASIQRSMLDVECSMLNALSSQAGVRALAIPRRRGRPNKRDLTGTHPGRR